jgi:hypothetical protein
MVTALRHWNTGNQVIASQQGDTGYQKQGWIQVFWEGGTEMASELFIGLHGSEDPTKATLPFLLAGGALDSGQQTAVVLVGDAVVLMNSAVAENVQGVGFPPLQEVMAKVIAAKVPIYI